MALNVLIVEDNFIIQMFLETSIAEMGHTIVGTASNSDDALSIIANNAIDLVLLDVGLSGNRNGIETARIINEKYKIPIVFITGNSDASTKKSLNEVDPIYIIYKPIDDLKLGTILWTISAKIDRLKSRNSENDPEK